MSLNVTRRGFLTRSAFALAHGTVAAGISYPVSYGIYRLVNDSKRIQKQHPEWTEQQVADEEKPYDKRMARGLSIIAGAGETIHEFRNPTDYSDIIKAFTDPIDLSK